MDSQNVERRDSKKSSSKPCGGGGQGRGTGNNNSGASNGGKPGSGEKQRSHSQGKSKSYREREIYKPPSKTCGNALIWYTKSGINVTQGIIFIWCIWHGRSAKQ